MAGRRHAVHGRKRADGVQREGLSDSVVGIRLDGYDRPAAGEMGGAQHHRDRPDAHTHGRSPTAHIGFPEGGERRISLLRHPKQ